MVEFVLVGTLLLFVVLGVIQIGLLLYVRNTLAADAAEGARHAASLGADPASGGPYAQRLVTTTVPGSRDARCAGGTDTAGDGTPLVVVGCQVSIPLSVVPLGVSVSVSVRGHAIKETP